MKSIMQIDKENGVKWTIALVKNALTHLGRRHTHVYQVHGPGGNLKLTWMPRLRPEDFGLPGHAEVFINVNLRAINGF